jgi:secreted Zn-dependent insulinase-like peptidase
MFHEIRESLIVQFMNEFAYTSEMANLKFSYHESVDFIKFKFEGYQAIIEEFITRAITKFLEFKAENIEDLYETHKENWVQDKNEFYFKKPVKQCFRYLGPVLSHIMVDEKEMSE